MTKSTEIHSRLENRRQNRRIIRQKSRTGKKELRNAQPRKPRSRKRLQNIRIPQRNNRTKTRQSPNYSEGVPLSYFPKGFDYYAGGHVHEKLQHKTKDYGLIAYPGCLFGATFTDLEETAQGEKRGFYIVDFEDKITQTTIHRNQSQPTYSSTKQTQTRKLQDK